MLCKPLLSLFIFLFFSPGENWSYKPSASEWIRSEKKDVAETSWCDCTVFWLVWKSKGIFYTNCIYALLLEGHVWLWMFDHVSKRHRIVILGFFFLSFLSQTRGEKLAKVYPPLRSALSTASKISVAHLLAARQDFSKILRTSSGKMREKTACAINKVNLTERPFNGL